MANYADAGQSQQTAKQDIVKIVWQGQRIAKLVFDSGRIIDFTRPVTEVRDIVM